MRILLIAAALFAAQPVLAATITLDGPPTTGPSAVLLPGDFAGYGVAGNGKSVDGDGRSWVVNSAGGKAYGRFDPHGGDFIDSQDRKLTVWTFARPDSAAFDTLRFALTDAHDQKNSYFSIAAGGKRASIDKRERSGTLHWVSIALDKAVHEVRVVFRTRHNDGFSVSSTSAVCR